MTKLAFDATGNLLNAISSRDIDESVLSESYPQSTIVKAVHRDVQIMRKPIKLVGGVVTEAPPPTEEELAAIRLDQLKLYTEESGLRYGCGILDPLTGEPSGDSNAPIGVISPALS